MRNRQMDLLALLRKLAHEDSLIPPPAMKESGLCADFTQI